VVRWLRDPAKIHATFDDRNLVSRAGLVPVMALTQRAGLAGLVDEHVRIARPCGVNPQVKVPCVVAGMIGGADSIDDLGLLRHGATGVAFVKMDSQQNASAATRSKGARFGHTKILSTSPPAPPQRPARPPAQPPDQENNA
jgi:hypothetical protein